MSDPRTVDGRSEQRLRRLALAVLIGGLGLFLLLVILVRHDVTLALDRALMAGLRAPGRPDLTIGPWWVEHGVLDLTGLGGRALLGVFALLLAGHLLVTGRGALALFVIASVAGALLLGPLLKSVFLRPRPDLLGQIEAVRSTSFPSAHALQSAAVYGILGPALAGLQHGPARRFTLAGAAALALLVGLTRVYLGVHYPTDVLAGWSIGAAWAALCWLLWDRASAGWRRR